MQSDLTTPSGGIWSGAFWQATVERALKTFAQAVLAVLTANQTDLIHTNWLGVLAMGGMATVLSVLTSIVSSGNGGPSLGAERLK